MPSRRWMSVPRRSLSSAVSRARGRAQSTTRPTGRRSTLMRRARRRSSCVRVGQRPAARRARSGAGRRWRRRRRAGPASGPRRPSRRAVAVQEQVAGLAQGLAPSKILVSDEARAAGLDHLGRVGALVRGRVRVGHHDHGQARGGRLGQRRGAGAAHEQVGRRRAPPPCPRAGTRRAGSARARSAGSASRSAGGPGERALAGDVDDDARARRGRRRRRPWPR